MLWTLRTNRIRQLKVSVGKLRQLINGINRGGSWFSVVNVVIIIIIIVIIRLVNVLILDHILVGDEQVIVHPLQELWEVYAAIRLSLTPLIDQLLRFFVGDAARKRPVQNVHYLHNSGQIGFLVCPCLPVIPVGTVHPLNL